MKKILIMFLLFSLVGCTNSLKEGTLSEESLGEFIKSPFLEDNDGITVIYEVDAEEYENGMLFEYEGLFYFLNADSEKFPKPTSKRPDASVSLVLMHEKNSIMDVKNITVNNKEIRVTVLEMDYGFYILNNISHNF